MTRAIDRTDDTRTIGRTAGRTTATAGEDAVNINELVGASAIGSNSG
jgi:hypothetical protein